MSTTTDNSKTREVAGKSFPQNNVPFGDNSGQYPTKEYENASGVNRSARTGSSSNELNLPGACNGIDLSEHTGGIESQYPENQVIETGSGHIIEYNDTKGSERILLKHTEGSGVDMRPDGSIIVNATGAGLVEVAVGGHKLVVTGDGQVSYSGNLTLTVGGDFTVNVGGAYNVQAKTETKTIQGAARELYLGNKGTTILGSKSDTITENHIETVLGSKTQNIKGDQSMAVQGSSTIASKGEMHQSSQTQYNNASPNTNISAESLSVFGNTGNIGGENITMHSYNSFVGHSLWATETVNTKTVTATQTVNAESIHGDLFGTASAALEANVAANPGGGGASQTSGSDAASDTTGQNDKANADTMIAVAASSVGIKKITIDEGDSIKNVLNKLSTTDNVTDRPLTLPQVRAKKRDAGHNASSKFNNYAVTSKQLHADYSNTIPPAVGETRDSKELTQSPTSILPDGDPTVRIKPANRKTGKLSVDPQIDPNSLQVISTGTKLSDNISLSEFAYGKGDSHGIDNTLRLAQKVQLCRNLLPQANFLSRIRKDKEEFKGYTLEVIEGLYIPHAKEELKTDGLLDLRRSGRAVVYELLGINGAIDKDKTFELACWMAKNLQYDEIILDYDTYDPFGDMNCQVILIMPEVPASYELTYKMETQTIYNGKKQDIGFMKIMSEEIEPSDPTDDIVPSTGDNGDDGEDESDDVAIVGPQ